MCAWPRCTIPRHRESIESSSCGWKIPKYANSNAREEREKLLSETLEDEAWSKNYEAYLKACACDEAHLTCAESKIDFLINLALAEEYRDRFDIAEEEEEKEEKEEEGEDAAADDNEREQERERKRRRRRCEEWGSIKTMVVKIRERM